MHDILAHASQDEREDSDVAILGSPLISRLPTGLERVLGPPAIRVASSGLADLKAYPGGYDPLAYLACADLGDVHFDYGNPHKIVEQDYHSRC